MKEIIAVILAIVLVLFIAWAIGARPSSEEVQRGEEMKDARSLGDCLGEWSTPCPEGYLQ